MALKSPTERINELETLVALLNERFDASREEIERLVTSRGEASKEFAELKLQLALLAKDLEGLGKWREEQKRERDEAARRMWAFGPNALAAVISGVISLGVALLVYWLNTLKNP